MNIKYNLHKGGITMKKFFGFGLFFVLALTSCVPVFANEASIELYNGEREDSINQINELVDLIEELENISANEQELANMSKEELEKQYEEALKSNGVENMDLSGNGILSGENEEVVEETVVVNSALPEKLSVFSPFRTLKRLIFGF